MADNSPYSRSHIVERQQPKHTHWNKNSIVFFFLAALWQIAAAIIYGLFFGYDELLYVPNSTNFFLNIYVLMAFMIFMIAGFTLMSAYITYSSATNMTFSILVSLWTLQNWFIYRAFWFKTGLPRDPMVGSFDGYRFNEITYLPTGNLRTTTAFYSSASFYQAIGACIAMFAALSPLFGRIGFIQVFFLSWIGPFFYELNSSIFNKFFIVDNGFGMRGFLFGGMLGLFISFIIGKKIQSAMHIRFMSHYHVQALTFIGAILVCLTYPNVISAGLLTTDAIVPSVAGVAQINGWLSLAGSIIGTYTACSLIYRKLYIHDIIYTSLAGAIAFSSSTTINYNPGAAIAIGSGVGFICSLMHTPVKRWMNKNGVRQSNSVIVQFIIPGIFACIMSSILQAVAQSAIPNAFPTPVPQNRDPGRDPSGQAGWQLMGFVFSLGTALICAIIVGLIMKCAHSKDPEDYFNDSRFITKQSREAVVEERSRHHPSGVEMPREVVVEREREAY